VKALNIETDTLGKRDFHGIVEANGQLRVPPQNIASVTAIVGANVNSIRVFLGDKVKKGDVLATLSHPDLLQLQTNYLDSWNRKKNTKGRKNSTQRKSVREKSSKK